jgi:hypothetical protein
VLVCEHKLVAPCTVLQESVFCVVVIYSPLITYLTVFGGSRLNHDMLTEYDDERTNR